MVPCRAWRMRSKYPSFVSSHLRGVEGILPNLLPRSDDSLRAFLCDALAFEASLPVLKHHHHPGLAHVSRASYAPWEPSRLLTARTLLVALARRAQEQEAHLPHLRQRNAGPAPCCLIGYPTTRLAAASSVSVWCHCLAINRTMAQLFQIKWRFDLTQRKRSSYFCIFARCCTDY